MSTNGIIKPKGYLSCIDRPKCFYCKHIHNTQNNRGAHVTVCTQVYVNKVCHPFEITEDDICDEYFEWHGTEWLAMQEAAYERFTWEPPYKTEIIAYKSERTGQVYPADEYCNHGRGGVATLKVRNKDGKWVERDFKDLPADEYPYTSVYKDPLEYKPKWMK